MNKINIPYLEYIKDIQFKKLHNNIFYLTIILKDKTIDFHHFGNLHFNIEDNDMWNTFHLEDECFDKILNGSFRYFSSRNKEVFDVIFIPRIDFSNDGLVNIMKEKYPNHKYFYHLDGQNTI